MGDIPIDYRDLLSNQAGVLYNTPAHAVLVTPFGKGASGREIIRLSHPSWENSLVGIAWTLIRADNHAFVPATRCLLNHGVRVPKLYSSGELTNEDGVLVGGWALVEDLGDVDLLSLKDSSWEEKRPYYRAALAELAKFSRIDPDSALDSFQGQAPFDESLYRWEQDYFAEHFLGSYLGRTREAQDFSAREDLLSLAQRLASLPRSFVHRDFQSQNIMLVGEGVALIDYQGMRLGRPEYDLASLLYDPYAGLNDLEREDLISVWEDLTGVPLDREIFDLCACQRLMQALGAFANIGLNAGKLWYFDQIPRAIDSFSRVLLRTDLAGLRDFCIK